MMIHHFNNGFTHSMREHRLIARYEKPADASAPEHIKVEKNLKKALTEMLAKPGSKEEVRAMLLDAFKKNRVEDSMKAAQNIRNRLSGLSNLSKKAHEEVKAILDQVPDDTGSLVAFAAEHKLFTPPELYVAGTYAGSQGLPDARPLSERGHQRARAKSTPSASLPEESTQSSVPSVPVAAPVVSPVPVESTYTGRPRSYYDRERKMMIHDDGKGNAYAETLDQVRDRLDAQRAEINYRNQMQHAQSMANGQMVADWRSNPLGFEAESATRLKAAEFGITRDQLRKPVRGSEANFNEQVQRAARNGSPVYMNQSGTSAYVDANIPRMRTDPRTGLPVDVSGEYNDMMANGDPRNILGMPNARIITSDGRGGIQETSNPNSIYANRPAAANTNRFNKIDTNYPKSQEHIRQRDLPESLHQYEIAVGKIEQNITRYRGTQNYQRMLSLVKQDGFFESPSMINTFVQSLPFVEEEAQRLERGAKFEKSTDATNDWTIENGGGKVLHLQLPKGEFYPITIAYQKDKSSPSESISFKPRLNGYDLGSDEQNFVMLDNVGYHVNKDALNRATSIDLHLKRPGIYRITTGNEETNVTEDMRTNDMLAGDGEPERITQLTEQTAARLIAAWQKTSATEVESVTRFWSAVIQGEPDQQKRMEHEQEMADAINSARTLRLTSLKDLDAATASILAQADAYEILLGDNAQVDTQIRSLLKKSAPNSLPKITKPVMPSPATLNQSESSKQTAPAEVPTPTSDSPFKTAEPPPPESAKNKEAAESAGVDAGELDASFELPKAPVIDEEKPKTDVWPWFKPKEKSSVPNKGPRVASEQPQENPIKVDGGPSLLDPVYTMKEGERNQVEERARSILREIDSIPDAEWKKTVKSALSLAVVSSGNQVAFVYAKKENLDALRAILQKSPQLTEVVDGKGDHANAPEYRLKVNPREIVQALEEAVKEKKLSLKPQDAASPSPEKTPATEVKPTPAAVPATPKESEKPSEQVFPFPETIETKKQIEEAIASLKSRAEQAGNDDIVKLFSNGNGRVQEMGAGKNPQILFKKDQIDTLKSMQSDVVVVPLITGGLFSVEDVAGLLNAISRKLEKPRTFPRRRTRSLESRNRDEDKPADAPKAIPPVDTEQSEAVSAVLDTQDYPADALDAVPAVPVDALNAIPTAPALTAEQKDMIEKGKSANEYGVLLFDRNKNATGDMKEFLNNAFEARKTTQDSLNKRGDARDEKAFLRSNADTWLDTDLKYVLIGRVEYLNTLIEETQTPEEIEQSFRDYMDIE